MPVPGSVKGQNFPGSRRLVPESQDLGTEASSAVSEPVSTTPPEGETPPPNDEKKPPEVAVIEAQSFVENPYNIPHIVVDTSRAISSKILNSQ